jgi:hypothetical protein
MEQSKISDSKAEKILLWLVVAALAMVGIASVLGLVLIEMSLHPNIPEPIVAEAALAPPPPDPDRVENGFDVETGFIAEGDYLMVKRNCTGCHSSKLVTQNRSTREGWEEMIRWMQREQKLWDLGTHEALILDYLAKYYGPEDKGRRQNLRIEEWYEISSINSVSVSPPN